MTRWMKVLHNDMMCESYKHRGSSSGNFFTNDIIYKMLQDFVNHRCHKCIHKWKTLINTKDKYNLTVHFIKWSIIIEEIKMPNTHTLKNYQQTQFFHTWASPHTVCFKPYPFIPHKACRTFKKRNDGTCSDKHYFTHWTQTHMTQSEKAEEQLRCIN